jgi:hypothetical protein
MKKWFLKFRNEKDPVQVEPLGDSQVESSGESFADMSQAEAPKAEEKEAILGKVDKALLIASILILLISVGLLFNDSWFNSIDDSGLTPIGVVKDSSNDVRRKVDSGLSWGSVSSDNRIYEGDSIFTGEGSTTEIMLDGGGSLKIYEKSLIVVKTKNGKLELDLQYGNVVGDVKSKQVVILNNGERTELDETSEPINIKKGENQLTQKVSINSSAEPLAEGPKLSIVPTTPASDARIWKNETDAIRFAWTTKKDLGALKLEFASDSAFQNKLGEFDAQNDEVSVTNLPQNDGQLYWRVRDAENKNLSVPRKFFVYADRAPIPAAPDNGREFVMEDAQDDAPVTFNWDDENGSKEWKVQISKDDKFGQIVEELKVSKRRAQSKPLAPGKYYWRVSGLHPARINSPWSEPWSFHLLNFRKLMPPAIENKYANYEIPAPLLQKAISSGNKGPIAVDQAQAPQLRWKQAPNAKSYVLEVASDKEFKKTTKVRMNKNALVLDKVAPKTIHWRVRSVDNTGKMSEPSEPGEMVIGVPAPRLQPLAPVVQKFKDKKLSDQAKAQADLKWTPSPFAAAYEIEAAKDPSFKTSKKMVQKDQTGAKAITIPTSGSFYFRVRALDAKGAPVSGYSTAQKFDYSKELALPPVAIQPEIPRTIAAIPTTPEVKPDLGVSKLPPPQLRDPNNNTSVVAFGSSPVFLNFRWRPVEGAINYKVEISTSAEFAEIIADYKTGETNYFFEKTLPAGNLYWRVRAELSGESTAWSKPNVFTVSYK